MRIAIFTTSFHPTIGGAEKQADMLARGLGELGHDVVVFAPQPKINNFRELPGIKVVRYARLRSKNWFLRGSTKVLEAEHRRYPISLVHAHGAYPAAWIVADWCINNCVPLVVRAYGGDILPGEEVQCSWLRRRRTRLALGSAKFLIAQNAELEKILSAFANKSAKIVRIRNGVDIANFAKAQPAAADFRTTLGSYAVTLSNFYEKKGLDILLKAWAIVTAKAPRHRLVICGHGPLETNLRELRSSLGLDDTVDFMGNVRGAEKIALLQGCACYVSSARREPFSNSLLEALASGAWLVATRTGGNIEVVQETRHGELVEPENPAELAAALLRALEKQHISLDEHERWRLAATFDWRLSIQKYQNEIIANL